MGTTVAREPQIGPTPSHRDSHGVGGASAFKDSRQVDAGHEKGPRSSSSLIRWRLPWRRPSEEGHEVSEVAQDGRAADAQSPTTGSRINNDATTPTNEAKETNSEADDLSRVRTLGTFRLRGVDDEEPQDWWFASTAIPLIAATFGPLANLMSVCALVTSWRSNIVEDETLPSYQSSSLDYSDPQWCISLNIASLVLGFLGNLLLLLNFTQALRYLVALPLTIMFWYGATGLLTGITIAMDRYQPPGAGQIYSQGFWYAIIASCLYMTCSMLLMVNMLGYFLGHYPQNFILTDDQRQLILQTMIFFVWLGGGGAVFSNTDDIKFVDAVYFCDVTILTIGFGDIHPENDVSRGLVFPYSVGGIIILGLMVSSIHKFAGQLSQENVIQKHVDRRRVATVKRAVKAETDLEQQGLSTLSRNSQGDQSLEPNTPLGSPSPQGQTSTLTNSSPSKDSKIDENDSKLTGFSTQNEACDSPTSRQFLGRRLGQGSMRTMKAVSRPVLALARPVRRIITNQEKKPKAIVMAEEKDRFDAMRDIQQKASQFKRYYSLTMSIVVFLIIWTVGAIGFWKAEFQTQSLTYFQALYLGYVSLTTIGYGDLSPASNAGKPLFVLWSLIAVPTMTILISSMGDTVIDSIQKGTFTLADWTVLPKKGLYRALLLRNPWLWNWMRRKAEQISDDHDFEEQPRAHPTIEELARKEACSEAELTRQLAFAIRRTATDLKDNKLQRYSYEDWVEFTRLIRFTHDGADGLIQDEEEYGIIDWDFLGEDSPMLSGCESEWVMDRLCESLLRLLKRGNIVPTRSEGETATQPDERGNIEDNHDEEQDQDSIFLPRQEQAQYTSIARIVHDPSRKAGDSTSLQHENTSRPRSASSNAADPPSIDPRHRGIGLFPELWRHRQTGSHHQSRNRALDLLDLFATSSSPRPGVNRSVTTSAPPPVGRGVTSSFYASPVRTSTRTRTGRSLSNAQQRLSYGRRGPFRHLVRHHHGHPRDRYGSTSSQERKGKWVDRVLSW